LENLLLMLSYCWITDFQIYFNRILQIWKNKNDNGKNKSLKNSGRSIFINKSRRSALFGEPLTDLIARLRASYLRSISPTPGTPVIAGSANSWIGFSLLARRTLLAALAGVITLVASAWKQTKITPEAPMGWCYFANRKHYLNFRIQPRIGRLYQPFAPVNSIL